LFLPPRIAYQRRAELRGRSQDGKKSSFKTISYTASSACLRER